MAGLNFLVKYKSKHFIDHEIELRGRNLKVFMVRIHYQILEMRYVI